MTTINNIKAQYNDIKHYRGDVFDEVWTIKKSDGTAYDLSGKTVKLTIKEKKTSETELVSMSIGDGIALSGVDNNVLTFNKVVSLEEKKYHYDIEVTEDNYTISFGLWVETYDVTR